MYHSNARQYVRENYRIAKRSFDEFEHQLEEDPAAFVHDPIGHEWFHEIYLFLRNEMTVERQVFFFFEGFMMP